MRPTRYTILLLALAVVLVTAACGATPTPTPGKPTSQTCPHAGTGATITLDGERLSFTCPPVSGLDAGLFGQVKVESQGWQLNEKTYAKTSTGFETRSTWPVLIAAITLTDGTKCAFAGSGATITLNNKRLNFTCPKAGSDEVGLIGDIQATQQGWTIEKASYTQSGDSFVIKTSALVPIRMVDVTPVR